MVCMYFPTFCSMLLLNYGFPVLDRLNPHTEEKP